MNSRINQLLKESGLQPYYDLQESQIEKFAELIIRDVVSTIKETQKTSLDFEWAILNNYSLEV